MTPDEILRSVPPRVVKTAPVTGASLDQMLASLPEAPITGAGLGKAAATGLRSGVEALPGTGGDIPALAGRGAGWAAGKVGLDPQAANDAVATTTRGLISPGTVITKALQMAGVLDPETASKITAVQAPTSQDVASVTDPAVTAISPTAQDVTRHAAQNPAERATETLTSLAPGALEPGSIWARLARVIAPAAGTEIGGEVGKQMGNEDAGRLVGGFSTALAPSAASRVLAGPQLTGERLRLARTLMDAGVDLTAGQASGRKALQYTEAGPFATKPAALAERQGEQFNRASLHEAGIAADRMTPDTVQTARDNFGGEYENLIRRTGGLPMDDQMQTDLLTQVDDFHRLKSLPHDAPTAVNGYFKRISDAARDNGGVIPTDVFAQIRSDISKDLRKLKDDPTLAHTLREFQDTLYGSIERNASPGIEGQWRDLNNRYRNFKTIEKSMLGPGGDTAEGMITPSKLRTAVQNADPSGYLVERGDLDQLARAGENIMKPLPQSGTTPRAYIAGTAIPTASALFSGHPMTALGVAGSAMIPPLASSVLTSRPVRTALVNRLTGRGPLPINPVTAALLLRQAQGGQ